MPTGVVRSFNEEEGYGFIQADDGDKLFVHHSNIEMEGFRTLIPGTPVAYEVEVGKRGPEAVRVRKI